MSLERTRRTMEAWYTGDVEQLADDVVFVDMGNHMEIGEEFRGRSAVGEFSDWLWNEAFDAEPEFVGQVIGEDRAVLEFIVAGTHVGEFAGVPPTGKEVRVPVCISYDLHEGKITRGRIYILVNSFLEQVGAA